MIKKLSKVLLIIIMFQVGGMLSGCAAKDPQPCTTLECMYHEQLFAAKKHCYKDLWDRFGDAAAIGLVSRSNWGTFCNQWASNAVPKPTSLN